MCFGRFGRVYWTKFNHRVLNHRGKRAAVENIWCRQPSLYLDAHGPRRDGRRAFMTCFGGRGPRFDGRGHPLRAATPTLMPLHFSVILWPRGPRLGPGLCCGDRSPHFAGRGQRFSGCGLRFDGRGHSLRATAPTLVPLRFSATL